MFFLFFRKKRSVAITELPAKAFDIMPVSSSIDARLDTVITWSCNNQAQYFDVFIGNTSDALFRVTENQRAKMYAPSLSFGQTLYFRIDSKNTIGTTVGDVKFFSTYLYDDVRTDDEGNPITDDAGEYILTSDEV